MPTKHQFTSAIPDGGDATLVRPSDWNDYHVSPYDTGTFTVADGFGALQIDLLALTSSSILTLEGTAVMVVL